MTHRGRARIVAALVLACAGAAAGGCGGSSPGGAATTPSPTAAATAKVQAAATAGAVPDAGTAAAAASAGVVQRPRAAHARVAASRVALRLRAACAGVAPLTRPLGDPSRPLDPALAGELERRAAALAAAVEGVTRAAAVASVTLVAEQQLLAGLHGTASAAQAGAASGGQAAVAAVQPAIAMAQTAAARLHAPPCGVVGG